MKKIAITAIESKTVLAERMIEDHVNSMHHPNRTVGGKDLLKNFMNINWCSESCLAEGTLEIDFHSGNRKIMKHINIPVITNFWVVCTKEKDMPYKITWSSSLS
jgi:hypothetical protein